MKNLAILILLAAALIAVPQASATNGYSYQGAWQPPMIYQSNLWYSKTASFSGPASATITTLQWQLEWNFGDNTFGVPDGLEIEISDAARNCLLINNPSISGITSFFQGESAIQTFTFWFKIPTATTVYYNPPYNGNPANSWLQENYQY